MSETHDIDAPGSAAAPGPASSAVPKPGTIYGVMAEFGTIADLLAAIHAARERGYRQIDAYTPFPSEEVSHALKLAPSRLPFIVLGGGVLGLLGGYFLQVYAAVIDYPTNLGGRPLHSWPLFIPITFECTILAAAFAAVFGMFALNRLPTPYHPVFNHPTFGHASRDMFFLCVEATDPKFDAAEVAAFFDDLEARNVAEIEA